MACRAATSGAFEFHLWVSWVWVWRACFNTDGPAAFWLLRPHGRWGKCVPCSGSARLRGLSAWTRSQPTHKPWAESTDTFLKNDFLSFSTDTPEGPSVEPWWKPLLRAGQRPLTHSANEPLTKSRMIPTQRQQSQMRCSVHRPCPVGVQNSRIFNWK